MSPARSKRAPKRRRDRLSLPEEFQLKFGHQTPGCFDTDDQCREAWEKHGAEILTKWKHAGKRPWAWYRFELGLDDRPRQYDPRDPAATNGEALWLAQHGHLAPWEIEHLHRRRRPSDGPALTALT
jgi:hypothetical protein